jgi:ABC-type lipoprotein release transport system permease subunit
LSAVGILLTVVMIAAYVPARRASRTDPAVLLRQE